MSAVVSGQRAVVNSKVVVVACAGIVDTHLVEMEVSNVEGIERNTGAMRFGRAKRIWRMALTLGAKRRQPAIFGARVLLTKARSYVPYCKLPNVRISYQNTLSR